MARLSVVVAFFLMLVNGSLAQGMTLLAFGDSLTAGYGLDAPDAFPAKLEHALRQRGHDVSVINGGVSGDTMAAGQSRLDWSLTDDVDAVIVELGANDALRGLDPAQTEAALDAILQRIREKGLPVLVAGMLAPRNMGEDYRTKFDPVFARQAEKHGADLYPFFLDGVAADPALNQPDGIHPNPAGVDIIVSRILPSVEQLIRKAAQK